MPDLIVVIPGILGSTLVDRQGRELWGASSGILLRALTRLGRSFEALRLPDGIGDGHPGDGVTAPRLMPIPHVVGKLLGADSYEGLLHFLKREFDVREPAAGAAGNLIRFPYDWRLSNRYNGKRIETELLPALHAWRKASGNPCARFVFVCHSMGGLVARWFLEALGGKEHTRRLITIGTPHRGSIEALVRLSNGFHPGFGPLRMNLTEIIRTLPSVHQLLPTWKCVEDKSGCVRIDEIAIPNVGDAMVSDALQFHATILAAAKAGAPDHYRMLALKGIEQPTAQSARLGANGVERIENYNGQDFKGDGTVPRLSSHPPEWESDDVAGAFGQQHATLQSDATLHRQLRAILTADRMEVYAAAGNLFGLDLPEVVPRGSPLIVKATSATGDTSLPLRVSITEETGTEVRTKLMRNLASAISGRASSEPAASSTSFP
jgi:pimeloyl-ACP methyl ester carboxylesterase